MKITSLNFFGSSRDKIVRMGLCGSLVDLQQFVLNWAVPVGADPAADSGLPSSIANCAPRLAVCSLFGTRKERVLSRVLRLRNAVSGGSVDAGVIVIASDGMKEFMPSDIKEAALTELRSRYGNLRKLGSGQSIYSIGNDAARIYFRYSKAYNSLQ